MRPKGILYLSNENVRSVLNLTQAIKITEQALRDHSENRVVWSNPEDLSLKPERGWQSWVTSCALPEHSVSGFRFRSIKAEGGSRDPSRIPTAPRRILILSDLDRGEILTIMDEDWCHAVRTGAAATVACRLLARKNASILAMLGAGDTARATLPVMAQAFHLEEVRVTSRRPQSRQVYARDLERELGLKIRAVDTTEEALRGAHIVISATTASEPFVRDAWLEEGIVAYSIGKHQEMESQVYREVDKLVVDSWEHCKRKSDLDRMLREGFLSQEDVYAELPQLIVGRKPGRKSDRERIFVRAIGLVNQDIAIAAWVYRRAVETETGTFLPF